MKARKLTALVYREYLDPDYLAPKPDRIVQADINEPVFGHRVPGMVICASVGDHLPAYGIDSDGSWPLGTTTTDGRQSDEICPGQDWTYPFAVTDEMVGAWPFHDHARHIGQSVNRGLFGAVVVLPSECDEPKRFELPPMVADFMTKRSEGGGHEHHRAAVPAVGDDHDQGHGLRSPQPGRRVGVCATMSTPGYHSAAILLADGSVLMGGDRPGAWKSGETTQHERYYPSYYALPRPAITAAPTSSIARSDSNGTLHINMGCGTARPYRTS